MDLNEVEKAKEILIDLYINLKIRKTEEVIQLSIYYIYR